MKYNWEKLNLKESSAIVAAFYDKEAQLCKVVLVNGRSYVYEDVEKREISAWLRAESVGKYFNLHIKNHNYQEI